MKDFDELPPFNPDSPASQPNEELLEPSQPLQSNGEQSQQPGTKFRRAGGIVKKGYKGQAEKRIKKTMSFNAIKTHRK